MSQDTIAGKASRSAGPRAQRIRRLGGVGAALVGALLLWLLADVAQAQPQPGSAELKRVTGRVEVLRKGQTQWGPAVVGAKLVEGDDLRAFAGASADLELLDGSTVLLTENSRILLTKLEVDPRQQTRFALIHLAVGKVRATIAQAAITLVRARQSNFAITTPTAVAAARGTILWAAFNATLNSTFVGVEPEPGAQPSAAVRTLHEISCTSFFNFRRGVGPLIVREGQASEECRTLTAPPPDLFQPFNRIAPGSAIFAPVSPPSLPEIYQILSGPPITAPLFQSVEAPPPILGAPSTVGQDTTQTQQPPPSQAEATSGSVGEP
ncbi:MAG: FecR family protein [Candidatus Rokuibacteriota bacterium]